MSVIALVGNIEYGEHTYFSGAPIVRGRGNTIHIGKYCSVAEGVKFDSGFNHSTTNISTFPFHTLKSDLPTNIVVRGDIIIENDVWLGENCTIMSGVKISSGAIIGMNAIISKDVPPYAIVVGAPQKILRMRFDPDRIKALVEIKWWDWGIEKIIENAHLLQSENIEEFINKHKNQNP